jgi:hypothetical protein
MEEYRGFVGDRAVGDSSAIPVKPHPPGYRIKSFKYINVQAGSV